MAGFVDLYMQEKQVGKNASQRVKSSLKRNISETTKSKTGNALRSAGSRSVYKNQRLQRITIQSPHYIFKQNYGFEGSKKNGVKMRLKATKVIDKVLDATNILETLADDLTKLRAEEVESIIRLR